MRGLRHFGVGFEQSQRLSGNYGRCQHHGQSKAEFLHAMLTDTQQQTGRYGSTRSRETTKWQTERLDSSDPAGPLSIDFAPASVSFFANSGIDDQHARRDKRRPNQGEL